MHKTQFYQHRIQRKIKPGDIRFTINDLDFTTYDRKIFFWNPYCYNKKYDFILLNNNRLKIGIQHQYLSANVVDEVVAAGSICVDIDGMVSYLDNQSGTFQFSAVEQQQYLQKLNAIISLECCEIFSINYQQYNPLEPILELCYNPFYKNIHKTCDISLRKLFIKKITAEKWKHVLQSNDFNWERYYDMNQDLHQYFKKTKKEAMQHFGIFGQYERGRAMGHYS